MIRVAVRYLGGVELYLGRAGPAAEDGARHVAYDDGDEENAVPAALLTAVEPLPAAAVGTRVLTRFDAADANLYWGTVTRVFEGMCDVRFDDGDSQRGGWGHRRNQSKVDTAPPTGDSRGAVPHDQLLREALAAGPAWNNPTHDDPICDSPTSETAAHAPASRTPLRPVRQIYIVPLA